jgi:hypothetical protein
MVRRVIALIIIGIGSSSTVVTAAPSPPSYVVVERKIDEIRKSLAVGGPTAQPNAPGWNALFDALSSELRLYSKAEDDGARLQALNRIYQISISLESVPWVPAVELRDELRVWLRPRVRLAWARQRLGQSVQALPFTNDPSVLANRNRWIEFAQVDLGKALREYDAADSVIERQEALDRIQAALTALRQRNQANPWWPSWELQGAVNDLFNQSNIDVSVDTNTIAPLLNANLIETGPVYRKGYWSQVAAGPKTGFGLLPSDDGIAFFNSQLYTTATPIHDFQNQIASDPQGQRAAKLYHFDATTYDWSELTITTVLRPSGLSITPSYKHNINASIVSRPEPGGGFGRLIATLVGMDKQKITDKVYQGAIGQFQQRIPQEAMEEGLERIGQETLTRNADLQAKGLLPNNTLSIRDFVITQLALRSRPEAVFFGGLFEWKGAPGQLGADQPQPAKLNTFEPGITADVHLGSLLTSALRGAFVNEPIKSVQNIMIVTKEIPASAPASEGVAIVKNAEFPAYLKALDTARAANNPKVTALRITKPDRAPEFSVDARGFLVALVHDLQIDVPAPPSEAKGGIVGSPAKVYRIKSPLAEIALSYQVDSPGGQLHVRAKVEEFNPGVSAQVLAINDDETKGTPLSRFSGALVIGAMGGRIRTQPIDFTVDQSRFPGFTVRAVSPLDPTGWVRVTLDRDPNRPGPAF